MEYTKVKKRKNIWEILGSIIYWLAITILIIFALSSILSIINLPIAYRIFSVETGSMKPVIKPGDLIITREEETYSNGDIITFESGTGESRATITHRIVETKEINGETSFITKGDFNSVSDVDPVDRDNIIGKYVFRIPLIGYPINFVRTPAGLILLIIVPATIIIYGEVSNIRNEVHMQKKQKEYS